MIFKNKKKFSVFIIIILCCEIILANNKTKTNVNVNVEGKIEKKVDFFGRRFYEGKIVNKLNKRIDFVYIEFKFFNDKNKLLETVKSYVYGSAKKFKDGTVSTSSIESGKTANFKCFTSLTPNSIKKYEYDIKWKVFYDLPEKY